MTLKIPITYNSKTIKKLGNNLVLILKVIILLVWIFGIFYFGYKYFLTKEIYFLVLSIFLLSYLIGTIYDYRKKR